MPDRIAERLVDMAVKNVREKGGGPFSCLILDAEGREIGSGCNEVALSNDPTAHAEIVALRAACESARSFSLPPGAVVYSSCEPCPMCRGALLWAGADRVVYLATRHDADRAGFNDKRFYEELALGTGMTRLQHGDAFRPFEEWIKKAKKILY
jgi:tRNA(Arg) A34 adenosine deaminase TadA